MKFENCKAFAFISGASRGIGREIAVQLSQQVSAGSIFLVTARNDSQLVDLKNELERSSSVEAHVLSCDLAKLDSEMLSKFENLIGTIIAQKGRFDASIFIHNAGTIGDLTKQAAKLDDIQDWHDYLQINFVSTAVLNNLLLKLMTKTVAEKRYIVNITSLLAVKAFPSMAQYGVGKAAREAYFRALAVEDPTVCVLNYSPGPVETDMYNEIGTRSYDEGIRDFFSRSDSSEVSRRKLSTKETVSKLLTVLCNGEFESGSRIDFFDD